MTSDPPPGAFRRRSLEAAMLAHMTVHVVFTLAHVPGGLAA